jgi:hypothetical protein
MKFAEELRIKTHAYRRYRQRVKPVGYFELVKQCKQQIEQGDYEIRKGLIHLSGIWWAYARREDGVVTFITCYGKSEMDMSAVLKWEKHNKDRINLRNMP